MTLLDTAPSAVKCKLLKFLLHRHLLLSKIQLADSFSYLDTTNVWFFSWQLITFCWGSSEVWTHLRSGVVWSLEILKGKIWVYRFMFCFSIFKWRIKIGGIIPRVGWAAGVVKEKMRSVYTRAQIGQETMRLDGHFVVGVHKWTSTRIRK